MAQLAPTSLRLIDPAWVHQVPAPAHDSLSPAERRLYVAENPYSYMTVTRSPEDLLPGQLWDPQRALAESRAALGRLVEAGAFRSLAAPGYYLYRLSQADHSQVGIVAGVSTEDYDRGLVRVHEHVHHARAEHLKTQLGGVGVQSSPIALAYRSDDEVEALVAKAITSCDPAVDFTAADGVSQQVWPVEADVGRAMEQALSAVPLYLVDGHHRAAAASRLRAQAWRAGADFMLSAIFSAADLRSEAFHRRLPGTDPETLLARVSERLVTREASNLGEVLTRGEHEVALLSRSASGERRWHLVSLPSVDDGTADLGPPAAARLLARLEPVRLQRHVLRPLLGIDTTNAADRLKFCHGRADRADLEQLTATMADPLWLMRPVALETVMDASDLGAVMPSKSTYFQPKVRSGVFLRPLA